MNIQKLEHIIDGNDLNEIVDALNCCLAGFSDSIDDENIFHFLETKYFKKGYKFLETYLAFYYYQYNEYYLAYFFSSKSLNANNTISILYYSLSLLRLGYNHIYYNMKDSLNIEMALKDKKIPISDRLVLCYLTKMAMPINCEKDIEISEVINAQMDLLGKKSTKTKEILNKLKEFANNTSDVLLKAHTYILLGHYFDKKYYSKIQEDVMFKNIEKEVFDDKIYKSTFNTLKYAVYNNPISNKIPLNDYKDDFIELCSFDDKIGNNLFALKFQNETVIIDAGSTPDNANIETNDYERFFKKNKINKESIKAVFFTHAHLDHIGNAKTLLQMIDNQVPVYVTDETIELGNIVNRIDFKKIRNTICIETNKKVRISDNIFFEFVNNGHILGSVAIVFNVKNRTILFTSDYCLHNQMTIKGLDLELLQKKFRTIDYLIMESTYGQKRDLLEYEDNLKIFRKLIEKVNSNNVKIFLPAFAIGRSQELLLEIKKAGMKKIHILGLAKEVCKFYDKKLGTNLLKGGVNLHTNDLNLKDIINLNNIIIASSGMLAKNSNSEKCYKELIKHKSNVALIKTGYIDDLSNGGFLIDDWKLTDKLYFEVSLSAHASYYELLATISYLKPKIVIAVHGHGID